MPALKKVNRYFKLRVICPQINAKSIINSAIFILFLTAVQFRFYHNTNLTVVQVPDSVLYLDKGGDCMGKRDLILDTMQELLTEQKGACCSVSDIAKRAGIAKGGMYYYFKSKEEVFDALVERTYQGIIDECHEIAFCQGENAVEKLERLYKHYRNAFVSSDLDAYLHQPQNAQIHQKSLAKILTGFSPIIAHLIEQGCEENLFQCDCPLEISEIILSVFCFLLNPGIFRWTPTQVQRKLAVFAQLIEKGLAAEEGSLRFFAELTNIYPGEKLI